jgi:PAS domain S-box-containing protein
MNLGENKELTLQAGERPGSLDTAAACVLLVDDQPARLLTYESILEGVGVTCVRALSGEEALKRLLKQEFAVIVLDVSMPGMDGFETARLIRSHHRFERTPIIFVTGVHVSELDTLRGYEVGGIDYISVPLVPEILRSKVALLVELYRRRTELQRVNAQLEQARAQLQTERDETIAASRAQLEEREARYHAIFEHPTEATVVLEAARTADGRVAEWRYRDANANALKVLRRSRETLIGKSLAEILPEGAQALADRCKTVLFERAALRYEEEDSGRRFLICLFPIGENTIVSSGLDITARRRAEEEIERAMRADRAEKEWLAAVLNSMNEEVYFTDRQGRYSYANPAAVSEFGYDGLEGADVRQLVSRLEVLRPDGTPRGVEEAPPLRALGGEMIRQEDQIVRIPRTGELRHRQVSSAPVRDMNGSIIGSVSVVRDVTEQKHAEELLRARDARSTALLRLGDKFRTLIAPADLAFAAAEMLGETLRVSRCGYGTIDPIAETITVERDWNAPGIATIAGVLRFREYGTYIEELKRGQTVICTDARTDPRTRDSAAALEHIKARSFVNMPVTEEVGVVALLYLNHESARTWSDEELAFIREVAHRTRVAVERRRGEQALAADLRYTNLLRHLAVRSVAEDNIRVLYEAILDAAIEITSADAGALQLFDDCTQTPRSVAIRGLPQELTHHLEQVNAPSGPPSAVALARGERVMLNLSDPEVAVADDASRIYRDSGLHSAQSTPLMSRSGRTLGMISTYWRSPHVLRERELRFLDLLARQATDLIDRTQVEEAIRESEQRLRAAAAEREQLLESERSARAEAERLSRMKDEFLATLSHELRTPLHSILGWASLMRNRGVGSVDYARGLEIIERNARAQSEIIAELLEMTSVVAGKIQLEARPVDLSQVLTNATDAVRPAADAKGIRLRVTLDAAATGVRGDAS